MVSYYSTNSRFPQYLNKMEMHLFNSGIKYLEIIKYDCILQKNIQDNFEEF